MVLKSSVTLLFLFFFPVFAFADAENTRAALERLEEVIKIQIEDEILLPAEVSPLIVVSAQPYYEESKNSFSTLALASLARVFPDSGIRICTPCMTPQTHSNSQKLEMRIGAPTLEEIRSVDALYRKEAPEAKAAVWIDETEDGVSFKLVDLQTARVIYAENVTANLIWTQRTAKNFTKTRDLYRRLRGDSLTHSIMDVAFLPPLGPQFMHVGFDWLEQWGDRNQHLSGITFTLMQPFIGIGASYAHAFPELNNALLGGKIVLSVPSALVGVVSGQSVEFIDPLVTFMGVVRFPLPIFGNYGAFLFATLNGGFGVGISALNINILPVVP